MLAANRTDVTREQLISVLCDQRFPSASARVFAYCERQSDWTLQQLAGATGFSYDTVQRQLRELTSLGYVSLVRVRRGFRVQTSVPAGLPLLPVLPPIVPASAAPVVAVPPVPVPVRPSVAEVVAAINATGQSAFLAGALPPHPVAPGHGAVAPAVVPPAASPAPVQPPLGPEFEEAEARAINAQLAVLNGCPLTAGKIPLDVLQLSALRFGARLNMRQAALEFVDWLTGTSRSAVRKRAEIDKAGARFDWKTCYSNHVKGCYEKLTGERQFTRGRRPGPADRAAVAGAASQAAASIPAAAAPETGPDHYTMAELDAAWLGLDQPQRDVLLQVVKDDFLRTWGANSARLAKTNFHELARVEAARTARKRKEGAA
jgi:hypothetical protein